MKKNKLLEYNLMDAAKSKNVGLIIALLNLKFGIDKTGGAVYGETPTPVDIRCCNSAAEAKRMFTKQQRNLYGLN